jgi:hypothetical protein
MDWKAQLGGAALALSLVGLGVAIAGIWAQALVATAAPAQPPAWTVEAGDRLRWLYRLGLVAYALGSLGVAILELEIHETIREEMRNE